MGRWHGALSLTVCSLLLAACAGAQAPRRGASLKSVGMPRSAAPRHVQDASGAPGGTSHPAGRASVDTSGPVTKRVISALESALVGKSSAGESLASAILIMPLVPASELPSGSGPQKPSHALVPMPLGALSGQGNFNLGDGNGNAALEAAASSAMASAPGGSSAQSSPQVAAGGSTQLDAAFSAADLYFKLPASARAGAKGKSWVSIPIDLLGSGNQKVVPNSLLAFVLPMDVPVMLSMVAHGIGSVRASAAPAGMTASSTPAAAGKGAPAPVLGKLSWYSGSVDVAASGRSVPSGISPVVQAFGSITAGQVIKASIGLGMGGSLGAVVLSIQPSPTSHVTHGAAGASAGSAASRSGAMQAEEVIMAMLPAGKFLTVRLPPAPEVLSLSGRGRSG